MIASWIKKNGVLKELKCAARPRSVRLSVSALDTPQHLPPLHRAHSLQGNKLGPEGGAALAEGLKGNSMLQLLE